MNPTFRNGRSDDIPAVARMLVHSFPRVAESPAYWEQILADSPDGGVGTLWVGESDGRLVAACRLLAFRQWIGGVDLPIMGLSTVAVSPSARKHGVGNELTATALRAARERGDVASALFPFRTSFYRRLGYGLAGEALQYVVPTAALPDHEGRERVLLVESAEDRAALAEVYARWVPAQSGQLTRSPLRWERLLADDSLHAVLYRDLAGGAAGYLLFRYRPGPEPPARAIDVEEAVWLTREARLGLYGWLASLGDQWERVAYRAHPDELFADHLRELRHPAHRPPGWQFWFSAAEVLLGPMYRVLNVPAAFAARPVNPEPPLTLALDVQDPVLPENSGTWAIRFEEGRAEVSRDVGSAAEVRMTIGIEALSRIHIGTLTATAAASLDLLTADRPEALAALDRILHVPRPWTFDRF